MEENKKSHAYIDTYVGRQPIFSVQKTVWGYELLYRSSQNADSAAYTDQDMATLTVASNAITGLAQGQDQGKKIFIHFTKDSITSELPFALPPESTVIEVEESFHLDKSTVALLAKMKKEGYMIAINRYSGASGAEVLLRLADIVFIDVLGKEREEIDALAQKVFPFSCLLAAKRVEDMEKFEIVKNLGFIFFQGYFLERPKVVPGRKLSSNQASRLNLFRVIEKGDPDFDNLSTIIQSDVSISFRLLSFINSPHFAFTRKIESIKQAIVLLGWKQLKSWLWLVILSDIMPTDNASEYPYLSAIRGKFLENVSANHDITALNPESLFLLGLFSLLDAMLETPMPEIVEHLPMDEELKQALCKEENEYSPWLQLSQCFETGDWDRLDALTRQLELNPIVVASSYGEALVWAKSFYGERA